MSELYNNYNGAFEDFYGDIRCLDDIFKKPACPGDVSSINDVFAKPSCDSGIYDLDDIVGLIGYYPPIGRHVCELDDAGRLNNEDLLLVSQVSSHDGMSDMTSKSITFYDLRKRLLTDVIKKLGMHTMAFKQPYQYAVSSHTHDYVYSRVLVELNPNASDLCSIAEIGISTDAIQSGQYDDISENPASAYTDIKHFTMCVPDICFQSPPRTMIGTLRFIGAAKMDDIVKQNKLPVGTDNVNPYDKSGVIRDDYDGWVFPNGSTIENKNNQLSAAAEIYGDASGNIKLPNLNGFFKGALIPDLTRGDQQVGLKPHSHQADPGEWTFKDCELDYEQTKLSTTHGNTGYEYMHQGEKNDKGEWSDWQVQSVNINNAVFTNAIYTTYTGQDDSSPKPEHDIIPVMIYIGGEKPEAN